MAATYCYLAGMPDDDNSWAEIQMVIAESEEAAAQLAFPTLDDDQIAEVVAKEDEYEVRRWTPGDVLAVANPTPRVIDDWDIMRSVGIHDEDDRQCECCGDWRPDVCDACNRCQAPGCRDSSDLCPDCDILPEGSVKAIDEDGEAD